MHHPTSEFGNSSSKPTSLRSFIALICLDPLKQCNSKSVLHSQKRARTTCECCIILLTWSHLKMVHNSRKFSKIISKFSLKLMQKTSFNKKIQKNPGDCITNTNISQHLVPPTSSTKSSAWCSRTSSSRPEGRTAKVQCHNKAPRTNTSRLGNLLWSCCETT